LRNYNETNQMLALSCRQLNCSRTLCV